MTGIVGEAGASVAPDVPSTAGAAAAAVVPVVKKATQPNPVPGNPIPTTDAAFTFVLDATVPDGNSTLSAPIDLSAVARNIAGPTTDGFHLRAAQRFHVFAAFGGNPSLVVTLGSTDAPCFPTLGGAVIDGPGNFVVSVNNTTGSSADLTLQFAAFPLTL